jgi:hypothetical protein
VQKKKRLIQEGKKRFENCSIPFPFEGENDDKKRISKWLNSLWASIENFESETSSLM